MRHQFRPQHVSAHFFHSFGGSFGSITRANYAMTRSINSPVSSPFQSYLLNNVLHEANPICRSITTRLEMSNAQRSPQAGSSERRATTRDQTKDRNRFSSTNPQQAIRQLQSDAKEDTLDSFTSNLKSLAVANTNNYDYTRDLSPLITALLDKSPFVKDGKTLANWIWSLPKLGFRSGNPQHREIMLRLIDTLYRLDGRSLTARMVTTSVTGMSKFKLLWNKISNPTTRESILRAVGSTCHNLNDQEIGMTLHSLCKIQVDWKDIPDTVRSEIFKSISYHKSNIINRQGSISIYSLGLMGLEFDELSSQTKDDLFFISDNVLQKIFTEDDRSAVQHVSHRSPSV